MEKERNNSESEPGIIRYLPYLYEIRKRLFFIISVFLIAWIVGFVYYKQIVLFVLGLYDLSGVNIAFTSPFQFLNLAINAGMIVGLIVVLPLVMFQVLSFLKPALEEKEYSTLLSLVPFGFMLFLGGFGFGTWMMRFVVNIFSSQTNELAIQNLWDVSSLLLGILFQFPLVLTFLLRLGIIKYRSLAKNRIPVYAVLLGTAVFMPPTDIVSLLMMFVPLALIFELTLLLNRNLENKHGLLQAAG